MSGLVQDALCLTLQKTFLCLHIIIECLQKLLYILDRQLLMFSKKPCNMYTTTSSNVYIEPLRPAEETFLGLQKIFLCWQWNLPMFTKKPSYVPMKLSNVNYETVHTMFTKKLLYVPITPSNVFNEIFLCLQRNLTMFKTIS